MDLDDEELKATKDLINGFVDNIRVQFVKNQEDFIIQECIRHLKEDKELHLVNIDETKLRRIFLIGLGEWKKRGYKL